MPKKTPIQVPSLCVRSLKDIREQLAAGVDLRDWEAADLERLLREHLQLQEGHEAVLALPDHPMRKPAKEFAARALGR